VSGTRKLRIVVAWGVPGVSDDVELFDLPEGWDQMDADRQQMEIAEYVEGIVWNRVASYGEVVEVDE
jgi:hypothetical protein